MKYSAVIFDLDGTVLENEDVYGKAFAAVFAKHKIPSLGGYLHTPGIGMEANWKAIKKTYDELKDVSVVQLVHETQSEYHDRMKDVVIRPGFFEFHQALKDAGVVMALATSNNWWLVEDELEDLDLHRYFEIITTGEEVYERKPAPDIFILTARKIHAEVEDCVVIEDSPAGVTAGKVAGMKVVVIKNTHNANEDFSNADLVVDGFYDLNLQVLESLFQK